MDILTAIGKRDNECRFEDFLWSKANALTANQETRPLLDEIFRQL